MPYGMKPPCAPKLLAWNLKNSTMMAKTGIATFHHVMPALTLENSLMARKLIAVKIAIRMMVSDEAGPGGDLRRRVVDDELCE